VTPNFRIVTARVIEALCAKGLLLEEIGSDVEELLVPFIHYVPFSNLHQFVAYSQYFQKHEDRRQEIADAGHDWSQKHFSSKQFWAQLIRRLEL
jgi:spore maturation protein CgeB